LDQEAYALIEELAELYKPPGYPSVAFQNDLTLRYKETWRALRAIMAYCEDLEKTKVA